MGDESPFVMLRWTGNYGNEPQASSYEVYAGPDSAAVAAHAAPPLRSGPWPQLLPRTAWPQDGPTYWTVVAFRSATGDEAAGPVWRFGTKPASAHVDSLWVRNDFSDYSSSPSAGHCAEYQIVFGPGYLAGLTWYFTYLAPSIKPESMRLAGARMVLSAFPGWEATLDSASTSLWSTTASWPCDGIRLGGPPRTSETDGQLADGVPAGPGKVRFAADALTAHLEASIRWRDHYGYVLRASRVVTCSSPTHPLAARRPTLLLYYYR